MDKNQLDVLNQFGDFKENVSIKTLTTLRIGGNCCGVLYPHSLFGLIYAIKYCQDQNITFKVFGNGSNILASDDFFDGIIIKLTRSINKTYIMEGKVFAEAGASLIALSHQIAKHNLSGLEWAAGIPATIGGATFMNAGAYLHSISEFIEKVCVMRNGECHWLQNEDCHFKYRKSIFQDHRDWIIVGILFSFQKSDKKSIFELMEKRQTQRMNTQPLQAYSCGSTFRNQKDHPTWKLIDDCNLRGFQVGGAQVSDKHTNFLINTGQSSFQDMIELIEIVQSSVYEKFNLKLKLEVEQFNWKTKNR